MSNLPRGRRKYTSVDPAQGYPSGEKVFYECTKCRVIIPSLPNDSVMCTCRNIAVDVDYGRVSVKERTLLRVFYED